MSVIDWGIRKGEMVPTVPFVRTIGWTKPGVCAVGLRKQAVGTGVGAEVEVKGSVLLEENEDVLDMPAEQIEFLCVTEIRRVLHAARVAGDFIA